MEARRKPDLFRLAAGLIMALAVSLACNIFNPQEDKMYVPEKATYYTAQIPNTWEIYVVVNAAGEVVDFGGPYAYGANARMRYEVRFWDVGVQMAGYEPAYIFKLITPFEITGINTELEEGMSDDEKAEIYARSSFPTTEVKFADLTFGGGPEGRFAGTNLETGNDIYGYMDWREKEWEMHVCFYHDVMKSGCVMDFLITTDEPFYNWP